MKLSKKKIERIRESITPVEIPKGYHYKVARYFDKSIHKDFVKMMNENFGTSKDFIRDLGRMHKSVDDKLLTVVIYNSKKQPVAVRQAVSNTGAGHIWVTNTFNPNIMFKGTTSMEVVRYYRPE